MSEEILITFTLGELNFIHTVLLDARARLLDKCQNKKQRDKVTNDFERYLLKLDEIIFKDE